MGDEKRATAELITNQSWSDYRALDRMNPSTLKHGLKSMKRLRRAIAGECNPDPKNVAVGNAVHCIIAGEIEDRYSVMPQFELDEENETATGKPSKSKSTTYYKEMSEAWREDLGDREEISEIQLATASKIANLLRKSFAATIDASGQEVTVLGEIEGVPMKTRLDGLHGTLVWDIKTTSDASDRAFYQIFKRLGYAFSAAVHVELLRQNGIVVERYEILVAEVGGDYDTRRLDVPLQLISAKLPSVNRIAREYKLAKQYDLWPGISDGGLVVPQWDMTSEDELEWEAK